MKRNRRSLFLLLLLLAAIATTLIYRTTIVTSSALISKPLSPITVTFNDTLVSLASISFAESQLHQEAEQLLEARLESFDAIGGRFRSFSLWRRGVVRPRSLTRLRVPISSNYPPARGVVLPLFRTSLATWRIRRRNPEPSSVMAELLSLVKHPIDLHHNQTGRRRRTDPYATCAVVGNSGIMLGSNHGELIDSHDFVIRLNNARTNGYAKDVGEKTSLSFVNSNILHLCTRREKCQCHPYGEDLPMIMYICQPVHFLDYVVCNSSHKSPLLITDPRLDALCARIAKFYSLKRFVEETGNSTDEWGRVHDERYFHYSSGLQAIVVALGICERVSVFGFGKMEGTKHHYHTNQKEELDLHDYGAEYEFYRDLVDRPHAIPFLIQSHSRFRVPPIFFYR